MEEKKLDLSIATILQILTVALTGLTLFCTFIDYISQMIWFDYWSIDKAFFNQNLSNITNNLIYYFFVTLILLFPFIKYFKNLYYKEKLSSRIKSYILFTVIYTFFFIQNTAIFNSKNEEFLVYFFCLLLCLKLMKIYIYKIIKFIDKMKEKDYIFITYREIIENILIFFVAIFISFSLIGLLKPFLKRDYKIIDNDNSCNTILYSTQDYYIVAECKIEQNDLIIYKDLQRKIDNYDIAYQTRNFNSIKIKTSKY